MNVRPPAWWEYFENLQVMNAYLKFGTDTFNYRLTSNRYSPYEEYGNSEHAYL